MKKIDVQTTLGRKGVFFDPSENSLYIQTTGKLTSQVPLTLSEIAAQIRLFSSREAETLSAEIRKRNAFARHSWENYFYVSRAQDLSDKTVIEVSRQGDPDIIIYEAQKAAELVERIALLSTTL